MKTPPVTPTVWTERYEALRQYVLGNRQSLGTDPLGLVLLVRQGMAAWMRCWRELDPAATAPPAVSEPPQEVCPSTPEWQQQLTQLLAQMTSANLTASSAL